MNNIVNKIINSINYEENMYDVIILFIIIFVLYYIIKILFPFNNTNTEQNILSKEYMLTSEDEVSMEMNYLVNEPLSLPNLDETSTESSSFYDNINIRTNNKFTLKMIKKMMFY